MKDLFVTGVVIASRGDIWPISVPNYRGVCRGRWWPLGDVKSTDPRVRDLVRTLNLAAASRPDSSLAPVTSVDAEFLRSFLAVCASFQIGSLYSLLCSSVEPADVVPNWVSSMKAECEYLGIDVTYASGGFSFVTDDYAPDGGEISEFLTERLNANGLFSSLQDAEDFLRMHQKANDDGANLETLDGAIAVGLWEDSDSSRLRRALGM